MLHKDQASNTSAATVDRWDSFQIRTKKLPPVRRSESKIHFWYEHFRLVQIKRSMFLPVAIVAIQLRHRAIVELGIDLSPLI